MDIFNLANYSLSSYPIPYFVVGLLVIALGLVVLIRNIRSPTHVFFFSVTFSITLWLLGNAFSFASLNSNVALFWQKVCWLGVILLVPNAHAFTITILGLKNKKQRIILVYLAFLPFVIALPFNLVVGSVERYYWGYEAQGGVLELPFMITFAIFMSLLLFYLIRAFRNKALPLLERKRVRILFISFLVAMLAMLDYLPLFGISFFPLGFIPIGIWTVIISYTITRHQLFKVIPAIAVSTIVDTMSDILFVTDEKGIITITNNAAQLTLGFPKQKIIRKSISTFIPDGGNLFKRIKKLSRKDDLAILKEETSIITKDREEIPVSISANVLSDASGYPIGMVIICHNIKEFKEASEEKEAALKVAEERGSELSGRVEEAEKVKKAMLNLLEDLNVERDRLAEAKAKDEAVLLAIGDGLVVTDKEGKIILVNKAFEEMLGWKLSEIEGKVMPEVVPMQDEKGNVISRKQRVRPFLLVPGKRVTPIKTTYQTTTETYYYVRKDKLRFPVTIISTPIILEEEVIGRVEIFRDVTREKDIDRAKTEFVSLASHQLRTPLSTVNWYAEMLMAKEVGNLNKEQLKYLEEIYKGNQRMVALVNSLLNISRLELGTFIIEPELVNLIKLVNSILDEMKMQIKEKNHQVLRKFEKKIPRVKADPKLMRIVLENLISNAVKYTPGKGKIQVGISCPVKYKDYILITVSDTGYGIPKKQQSRVFTKLFRGDNVRSKEPEGTGLGLYIVKLILGRTGGRIWFESEENKGTTFYVIIPKKGMKERKGTKYLT